MPSDNASPGGIPRPSRPLSSHIAKPILFLAERMAQADQDSVPRETRMIDRIADAVGLPTFRYQPWFRDMTEAAAVSQVTSDMAKRGALVVLSLILKADVKRKPSELAYFRRIREALRADPVRVPVDLEAHLDLALAYFLDQGRVDRTR